MGEIYKAAELIMRESDRTSLPEDLSIYDQRFFRRHLRAISMPLYRRSKLDGLPLKERDDDPGIDAIYPKATRLLSTLSTRNASITERAIRRSTNPESMQRARFDMRGDISELLVFCLTTRKLTGTAADEFTILPATRVEDSGTSGDVKTGFDFHVYHRPSGLDLPTQVKTSDLHTGSYAPDIAVVVLTKIASSYGTYPQVQLLERAVIADGDGCATPIQIDYIEQATRRLELVYLTKLVENSEQQKTA